jgi:hypothetical protein
MSELNINNIIKRAKGRPKLSEEEKLVQLEKRKEYQHKYNKENKDKIYKKHVEYINNNIEKIKSIKKNHYINNKEKYIENAKKHRIKLKDELKQKNSIIQQLLNENKLLNESFQNLLK